MQSLRPASMRRLCLSFTASVTQRPQNLSLSAPFHHTRSFVPASSQNSGVRSRSYWGVKQEGLRTREEYEEEGFSTRKAGSRAGSVTNGPTNTIFIGNIPYSTTERDLQETFSVYEEVNNIRIGRQRNGTPKGYAHVEFETTRAATKVIKEYEESPMMIGDRSIRMDYAYPSTPKFGPGPPRHGIKDHIEPCPTIFVGNLRSEVQEEDIVEALRPLGNIAEVRLGRRKDGTSAFAHVEFANTEEAEGVLKHYQHHSVSILGQEARLDRALPAPRAYPPSNRLHFKRWGGNASLLRSHFRALSGKILDIIVFEKRDPNTQTISGIVVFRDTEAAEDALARFNGPALTLAFAKPVVDLDQTRDGGETRDPTLDL